MQGQSEGIKLHASGLGFWAFALKKNPLVCVRVPQRA
jgi:hypothetical protein